MSHELSLLHEETIERIARSCARDEARVFLEEGCKVPLLTRMAVWLYLDYYAQALSSTTSLKDKPSKPYFHLQLHEDNSTVMAHIEYRSTTGVLQTIYRCFLILKIDGTVFAPFAPVDVLVLHDTTFPTDSPAHLLEDSKELSLLKDSCLGLYILESSCHQMTPDGGRVSFINKKLALLGLPKGKSPTPEEIQQAWELVVGLVTSSS